MEKCRFNYLYHILNKLKLCTIITLKMIFPWYYLCVIIIYHLKMILFFAHHYNVVLISSLGIGRFSDGGIKCSGFGHQQTERNETKKVYVKKIIGGYMALDHTFVLTESGLATINLKNCGRYFRSPSPSLYNAVQTSLKIVNQH